MNFILTTPLGTNVIAVLKFLNTVSIYVQIPYCSFTRNEARDMSIILSHQAYTTLTLPLPQAIIIGFCKQHRSRWEGSYEPSHLDLCCLTFSLSTLRISFTFSSDSLLKRQKKNKKKKKKKQQQKNNNNNNNNKKKKKKKKHKKTRYVVWNLSPKVKVIWLVESKNAFILQ